jgi:RHS repeat-associated protein
MNHSIGFSSETYDLAGNVASSEDGDGNVTENVYDGNQSVATGVLDANDQEVSFSAQSYDLAGNVTSSTDGDGNITTNTYDGNQLTVSEVTDAKNNPISVTSESYDLAGNVVSSTDGDGNVTVNEYDGGQLDTTTVFDSPLRTHSVSFSSESYDLAGNVVSSEDGAGNVTVNEYDGNQLVATTVFDSPALNRSVSFSSESYDLAGNVVLSESGASGVGDGNIAITSNTYDGNQLVATTVFDTPAMNHPISFSSESYDLAGDVVLSQLGDGTVGDRNVTITSNTYDGGQLLATTVFDTPAMNHAISVTSETYDLAGNVKTSTDGDGNITSNFYDGNQLVATTVSDRAGTPISRTLESYDLAGNMVSSTDGDGNVTSNTYDGGQLIATELVDRTGTEISGSSETYDLAGNVKTSTDGDSNITTNTYDGNELIVSRVTDANQKQISVTSESYDLAGNVKTSTDGDGNITSNFYDGGELVVTTVSDGSGKPISSTSESYDLAGNVVLSRVGGSNDVIITSNTYDGNQLIATVVTDGSGNPISRSSESYDLAGSVVVSKDGDGNITSNTYDGNQLVATTVFDSSLRRISASSESYDLAGNVTSSTDGDGNITSNFYDGNQLVATETFDNHGQPISSSEESYDLAGNVASSTDGDGNITSNFYDGNQLVATEVFDVHTGTIRTTEQSYDQAGNVVSSTDGDGNVTKNTYDGNQLIATTVKDSLGQPISTSSESYDMVGNVASSTDGDGNITSNFYDGNQLIATETFDKHGQLISTSEDSYDLAGYVVSSTDGDGNITSNFYDGGQLIATETFDSHLNEISASSQSYDLAGNVKTSTDGDGNITSNTYDGNQLIATTVKDRLGTIVATSSQSYDLAGNVKTSTDGDGNITSNTYDGNQLIASTVGFGTAAAATTLYGYDQNGNRTSITDPDNNTTSFTFDANGNVLTSANALGTTSNAYDGAGNLVFTRDADGRTISSTYDDDRLVSETWSDGNFQSFSYDAEGNEVAASDNAGTYTLTYDDNRVATRTDPSGLTLSYGYDGNGNLTSIQDSQGGLTTMAYNADGQVTSKTYQDGSVQLRVDFAYDVAGNITSETRFRDVAGTQLVGTTVNGYDDNRLTSIVQKDGSGNVIASYGYAFDKAGRLTSETDNGATTDYTYDSTGQLTQAGTKTYTWDPNGNPVETVPPGPDNELLTDGTWNYGYDAVGNMTSKTNIATGETWSFGYDNANHMTSAVDKQSDGTLISSTTFTFDVFGHRIAESVTQGGSTTTQKFVYGTYETLYADENAAGTVQTRYISDVNGPDTWLARVSDSGGSALLLSDHLGSIRTVVALTGGVLDQINYDAFGNITSETDSAQGGRLKFQGGELDSVTGTYKYGDRDYSPQAMRWTTQDVTGFGGGDTNFYRFVHNMPVDATDPSGNTILFPYGYKDTREFKGTYEARYGDAYRGAQSVETLVNADILTARGRFSSNGAGNLKIEYTPKPQFAPPGFLGFPGIIGALQGQSGDFWGIPNFTQVYSDAGDLDAAVHFFSSNNQPEAELFKKIVAAGRGEDDLLLVPTPVRGILRSASAGAVERTELERKLEEIYDNTNDFLKEVGEFPGNISDLWDAIKELGPAADDAITAIRANPKQFKEDLFAGATKGFENFFDNIGTHLQNGLLEWLTEKLNVPGLELTKPDEVPSLDKQVALALHLMGLSPDDILGTLVNKIGPDKVAVIVRAYEHIAPALEAGGPEGVVKLFENKLMDFTPAKVKDAVIDVAKQEVPGFIAGKIGEAIIKKIAPGANILHTIYAGARFILGSTKDIKGLIGAVKEGMVGIAKRAPSILAKAITSGLAKLVRPAIRFLATQLGFGNLATKVTDILQKVAKTIRAKAVDPFIEAIAKIARTALGFGANGAIDPKYHGLVGDLVPLPGGEHHLWVAVSDDRKTARLYVGSTPQTLNVTPAHQTAAAHAIAKALASAEDYKKLNDEAKKEAMTRKSGKPSKAVSTEMKRLLRDLNRQLKALTDDEKKLIGDALAQLGLSPLGITRRHDLVNRNGTYHFTFDSEYRTKTAKGPISDVPESRRDRKKSQQDKMLDVFLGNSSLRAKYNAGHLIGNQIGGPGDIENLVPMMTKFNQNGAWKEFEEWLAKSLADNRTGTMEVTVTYGNSDKVPDKYIPTRFHVSIYFRFASGGGYAGSKQFDFKNDNNEANKVTRDSPTPGSVFGQE